MDSLLTGINYYKVIYDALNFIKKLTLLKISNILKVRISFCLSVLLKKPTVWGMPYSYSIESSSICNLTCPECPTGKGLIQREKNEMPFELYQSIIGQITKSACYLMLYLQGEPFRNQYIFEMISLANKKKIYTFLATNGHFLGKQNATQTVRSGLSRIMISVDGATNDVYRQYRQGGNLEVVLEGIKNLVEAKHALKSKTPYIILQFIVFKHNQHQIKEFQALGKSVGANKTELKVAQLYNFEHGHPMMTDLEKYSRYRKSGNYYVLKKNRPNSCKRIWTTGVITTDGILVPCCYDKEMKYPMGDTNMESLKMLWKGKPYMLFRKTILENRMEMDICCNCNE